MTRYLAAVALTWAILSAPAPVGACWCTRGPSDACAAASAVDAVFVAEVVDSAPAGPTQPAGSDPFGLSSQTRNRMRVSEAFRGDVGDQVDVYTEGGSSCAFGFERGVPYVVYARRAEDGRLHTGGCLRTHRVATRPDDVAQLRAMKSRTGRGSIVGAARSWSDAPVEGLSVIAQSDGARYETTTGPEGQFSLPVPRGSYRVTYGVGEGLYAAEARVDVVHDQSCVSADVSVVPDGRLTGRVVDTSGTPVANMSVFLAYAEANQSSYTSHRATTDADGVYRLTRVRPGLYLLGAGVENTGLSDLPSFFHPGVVDRARSTRVGLELGERKTLSDLIVPADVDLFTVTGTVRDRSGAPVPDVTVTLNELSAIRPGTAQSFRPAAHPVTTDREGRFTISAVAGRYSLEAWLRIPDQTRSRSANTDLFDGAGRVDVTITLPEGTPTSSADRIAESRLTP